MTPQKIPIDGLKPQIILNIGVKSQMITTDDV